MKTPLLILFMAVLGRAMVPSAPADPYASLCRACNTMRPGGLSSVIPPDRVNKPMFPTGIFMIRNHNPSKTLTNHQSVLLTF